MLQAGQALLATTDQAARAMLHACLAPREQVAGRYLALGRVYQPDKVSGRVERTSCPTWGVLE